MGGLRGVSITRDGRLGISQGTDKDIAGMAATLRVNSGRHAAPIHADRSQDTGSQQLQGIS